MPKIPNLLYAAALWFASVVTLYGYQKMADIGPKPQSAWGGGKVGRLISKHETPEGPEIEDLTLIESRERTSDSNPFKSEEQIHF